MLVVAKKRERAGPPKSTLTDTRSNSRETDSRKQTDMSQATPTDRSPPVSLTTPAAKGSYEIWTYGYDSPLTEWSIIKKIYKVSGVTRMRAQRARWAALPDPLTYP